MSLPVKRRSPKAALGLSGDFMPRSFVEHLRLQCPAFGAFEAGQQHHLAKYLWSASSRRVQHSTLADCFTMHWEDKQRRYGSAKAFELLNASVGWFVKQAGAIPSQNIAAAWACTDVASELAASFFNMAHLSRSKDGGGLLTVDGKTFKFARNGDAIRATTSTGGNTSHPRGQMKHAVVIDGDMLHRFHAAADAWLLGDPAPAGFEQTFREWDALRDGRGPNEGEARARTRVQDAQVHASAFLHIAKASAVPGYVLPVTYTEHTTGRLFAEGEFNLQGTYREVRRAALAGCWDADISNAHWCFLQQLAGRLGLRTPHIDAYLADKAGMRNLVAARAGISTKDAKTILLGIVYGMNLQATEAAKKAAIIELIGAERAAMLRHFEPLQDLYKEVCAIRKPIIEHYAAQSTRRGHIVNDLGRIIAVAPHAKEPGKLLAHILQGIEALILSKVIAKHGESLRLLAHDGWVMAEQPNKAAMEAMIERSTGYKVALEVSQF